MIQNMILSKKFVLSLFYYRLIIDVWEICTQISLFFLLFHTLIFMIRSLMKYIISFFS